MNVFIGGYAFLLCYSIGQYVHGALNLIHLAGSERLSKRMSAVDWLKETNLMSICRISSIPPLLWFVNSIYVLNIMIYDDFFFFFFASRLSIRKEGRTYTNKRSLSCSYAGPANKGINEVRDPKSGYSTPPAISPF
jgi:hypothetical protein